MIPEFAVNTRSGYASEGGTTFTSAPASSIEDFNRLADTIVAHLPLKIEDKQEILEIEQVVNRMERILEHIETELDILQVEKRISLFVGLSCSISREKC